MTDIAYGRAERVVAPRSRRAVRLQAAVETLAVQIANPPEGRLSVVGFVSCARRDGTTTIACATADHLQSVLGRRVLLIDANLSAPKLHDVYGIPAAPGLTDLLAGRATLREVVHPVDAAGLHVIPAGTPTVDVLRQLDGHVLETMKERLREVFDLLIFDCTPLDSGAQTFVLAKRLDGLVLVLAAEKTRWQSGARTMEKLRASNTKVLGAVLNGKRFFIPRILYKRL